MTSADATVHPGAPQPEAGGAVERSLQEADLLRRLRSKDAAAYRELLEQHGGRMLATARRLLGNEADAQDALQDACLSAFQALASFDGRSRLGTWLHRIVVNAALMKLRSRPHRAQEEALPLEPEFVGLGVFRHAQQRWSELPEDQPLRDELCREVRQAIAALPEPLRLALFLRDMEELSNSDLARELGVSVNAAKIRVHRARQALRALLASRFEA
jgi:RNA polymerase sigma-70 factor (ECF subfamily)